jgi:hypothetical protein
MYEFIEMMDDNDDVSSILPYSYSSRRIEREDVTTNRKDRNRMAERHVWVRVGHNQRPLLIFRMCTDHPNTDRLTMRGVRGPGV